MPPAVTHGDNIAFDALDKVVSRVENILDTKLSKLDSRLDSLDQGLEKVAGRVQDLEAQSFRGF